MLVRLRVGKITRFGLQVLRFVSAVPIPRSYEETIKI